jgi:hypothetical protein
LSSFSVLFIPFSLIFPPFSLPPSHIFLPDDIGQYSLRRGWGAYFSIYNTHPWLKLYFKSTVLTFESVYFSKSLKRSFPVLKATVKVGEIKFGLLISGNFLTFKAINRI